ncbi:hypothetical protein [Pseudolactococcus laudensis]|uniref:hypothetical protein n=1 Tax=Pseudolactococcus laudensis TaxID=1494461 RepID=UPI0002774D2D|nr:hypothetical protein BN193_09805 [Lactococcus raffinolactis 4877]
MVNQLIQKSGADPAELKTYLLELVGTEQDLSELSISDLIGSDVELERAKVMLKWEQGRNGGSWRGLKVVLNISASLPLCLKQKKVRKNNDKKRINGLGILERNRVLLTR